MAGQNKIEQFMQESRVLDLAGIGKTTYEIAEIVSSELRQRDIQVSISQSAVSRFMAKVRKDRAEQTRSVVQEHIKQEVPKDLDAIEEIEAWLLAIFRDQREIVKIRSELLEKDEDLKKLLAVVEGKVGPAGHDLKTRIYAAMKAVDVIELKLKYSGILETPDDQAEARALAKEAEELLDPDLEKGIDALGSTKS